MAEELNNNSIEEHLNYESDIGKSNNDNIKSDHISVSEFESSSVMTKNTTMKRTMTMTWIFLRIFRQDQCDLITVKININRPIEHNSIIS